MTTKRKSGKVVSISSRRPPAKKETTPARAAKKETTPARAAIKRIDERKREAVTKLRKRINANAKAMTAWLREHPLQPQGADTGKELRLLTFPLWANFHDTPARMVLKAIACQGLDLDSGMGRNDVIVFTNRKLDKAMLVKMTPKGEIAGVRVNVRSAGQESFLNLGDSIEDLVDAFGMKITVVTPTFRKMDLAAHLDDLRDASDLSTSQKKLGDVEREFVSAGYA